VLFELSWVAGPASSLWYGLVSEIGVVVFVDVW
jgi:hypothetical protein